MTTIHKALFVMSSSDRLTLKDGSTHRTGFYASEFVEPYDAFKKAGIQVEVATPDGRTPPVDPISLDPGYVGKEAAERFKAGIQNAGELAHPRRLSDVRASDYDVVFVPGGHAPVEDLPYSKDVQRLLIGAHASSVLVAALCHGPAALLAGVEPNGHWLYAGKHLTSFSKAEEDLTPVAGKMKWELETALRDHGAIYARSQGSLPFEGYVRQDGLLITGENPNSGSLIGSKVVQALQDEKPEANSVSFSVHRDVAAPPDSVWSLIGHFDTLPWHPGIASGKVESTYDKTRGHGWPVDPDRITVRTLVAQGGSPVFKEQLLESGDRFLRYKMLEGLPVQPVSTLRVEPNGKGSRIVWEADFDTSKVDDKTVEAVTKGVTAFYEAGLNSLQTAFGKA